MITLRAAPAIPEVSLDGIPMDLALARTIAEQFWETTAEGRERFVDIVAATLRAQRSIPVESR